MATGPKITVMEDDTRRVWILARPLSLATWFPPFVETSNTKFHLCHWGVLITANTITITDVTATLRRECIASKTHGMFLGPLYELKRIGASNTVNKCASFGTSAGCQSIA